eukprot:COSAG04_NODE_32972_length_188_cov_21.797753_1_plen_34_part_10
MQSVETSLPLEPTYLPAAQRMQSSAWSLPVAATY